ncbi:MAG: preQ(1) synthase [Candidatus Helarchaeota archaeon]
MNDENRMDGLTHLKKKVEPQKYTYDPKLLEHFPNKYRDRDYWVSLTCFEFTSLCPVTGQPDHATIFINYVPDEFLIESKSLKLYLQSFRNEGAFNEDLTNRILDDLINLINPRYMEVISEFNSRGGIIIIPFVNYGKDPDWKEFAKERFLTRELETFTIEEEESE